MPDGLLGLTTTRAFDLAVICWDTESILGRNVLLSTETVTGVTPARDSAHS